MIFFISTFSAIALFYKLGYATMNIWMEYFLIFSVCLFIVVLIIVSTQGDAIKITPIYYIKLISLMVCITGFIIFNSAEFIECAEGVSTESAWKETFKNNNFMNNSSNFICNSPFEPHYGIYHKFKSLFFSKSSYENISPEHMSYAGNFSTGEFSVDALNYPSTQVLKDILQVGKIGMNSKLYMQHIVAIHEAQYAFTIIIVLTICTIMVISVFYDFSPIKKYISERSIVIKDVITNKYFVIFLQILLMIVVYLTITALFVVWENLEFLIENPITASHGALMDEIIQKEQIISDKT
ncbi:unnamed protein product (mitochondrion) [Parajaminaea phylloscopi]|uniref:Uncharacterized protein n=1 Tax=Parajaminaea phylloscopi TaxID=1463510 RepID=A0AB39A6Z5_9BASI